jgi:hypothetical protein
MSRPTIGKKLSRDEFGVQQKIKPLEGDFYNQG